MHSDANHEEESSIVPPSGLYIVKLVGYSSRSARRLKMLRYREANHTILNVILIEKIYAVITS